MKIVVFCSIAIGTPTSPKRDAIHQRACELRRQGATLADIRAALQREGFDVSESYLFRILCRAGLATTRQGRPLRQPGDYANDGSLVPDIADARALVLEDGRQFPTKVAGLFLFLPLLLDLDLPQAVTHAELPGSEQIPPLQALLALLVAKLLGKRRVSHISDLCCDEGAGLFAGLNVLPKATYATDYSYKTERVMTERLIAAVIAKTPLGEPPLSFNLDFHAIPFRGTEPDLENHWVPMRNRALPAVGDETNLALVQLVQPGIGGRTRVEEQPGRVVPRLFFPVIGEPRDHVLGLVAQEVGGRVTEHPPADRLGHERHHGG